MDEDIEDITTTTFSIAGVPIKVFKRFIKYCEDEAQMTKVFFDKRGTKQIKRENCYSIALAKLLDAVEMDARTELLNQKINMLEDRVRKLENV